jgi:hypothetical protein
MKIDEFWSLVQRVHAASPADMDEKCRLLSAELRQLSCEQIRSFGSHFRDLFYQAYNWEVWAAAYIINGGCSDDGFMDFRSTLISLGRDAYSTALSDVDSLVEFNIDPAWATYEGYQYVAGKAYEDKCGSHAANASIGDTKPHPKEPTGRDWHEWDLHERYPRLAAKYGWGERDWSAEKKRHEKLLTDEKKGRHLAELMLDAHIIPSCGLIPPPRTALQVFCSGRSPSPLAKVKCWQAFDIDEGHYWIAARCLHQPSPDALGNRPDLVGVKITVDTGSGPVTTYAEWERSLRIRGLATT